MSKFSMMTPDKSESTLEPPPPPSASPPPPCGHTTSNIVSDATEHARPSTPTHSSCGAAAVHLAACGYRRASRAARLHSTPSTRPTIPGFYCDVPKDPRLILNNNDTAEDPRFILNNDAPEDPRFILNNNDAPKDPRFILNNNEAPKDLRSILNHIGASKYPVFVLNNNEAPKDHRFIPNHNDPRFILNNDATINHTFILNNNATINHTFILNNNEAPKDPRFILNNNFTPKDPRFNLNNNDAPEDPMIILNNDAPNDHTFILNNEAPKYPSSILNHNGALKDPKFVLNNNDAPKNLTMEERRNVRAEEMGDTRENPSTSDIVRHNSHMRKFGSHPAPAHLPPRRPGFNPRPGHFEFSHVGIVPDDAVVGRRVFSGISRFPAPSFRRCSILASITLIGSQDLDIEFKALYGSYCFSDWLKHVLVHHVNCLRTNHDGRVSELRNPEWFGQKRKTTPAANGGTTTAEVYIYREQYAVRKSINFCRITAEDLAKSNWATTDKRKIGSGALLALAEKKNSIFHSCTFGHRSVLQSYPVWMLFQPRRRPVETNLAWANMKLARHIHYTHLHANPVGYAETTEDKKRYSSRKQRFSGCSLIHVYRRQASLIETTVKQKCFIVKKYQMTLWPGNPAVGAPGQSHYTHYFETARPCSSSEDSELLNTELHLKGMNSEPYSFTGASSRTANTVKQLNSLAVSADNAENFEKCIAFRSPLVLQTAHSSTLIAKYRLN
ncbi:hypothetical protein PR048_024414 [Dryococelus australis]|uniref:Uncharacterized protein n=1 Tax=Dryococelus australis TaxID=614101 RepID=A0ABQ9GNJ4_9NEOP|nr:hypothetical protein PR048_024414 [Dryococelus australis]